MSNHLIHENSPYLLQHAANPVDWYPWGEEALEKARLENKPIFLSIGYAACHWCHVMAHESFEDPETAAILNENFVSIKVDREQRPDLDSIYMQATTALTGSGGWPMSMFLTPDLRPFYAGTYFPPVRRYGMPAFREVLLGVVDTWRQQPDEVLRLASQITERLQGTTVIQAGQGLDAPKLDQAVETLLKTYDWEHGGWGRAPKFPQPMAIDYLLRQTARRSEMGSDSLKAALHALRAMARGGMYDVVGGGFARYSTDDIWRVPHFEKMLYDNAQLALAYLHAWQITRLRFFERIATETLDFVLRELTGPEGGFYSSLDADSEGAEGKFYVWTKDEIHAAIAGESSLDFFTAAYGVTDKGNWDGHTVLQRALDDATLAARFHLEPEQVYDRLAALNQKLLAARSRRVRPATDDKVLTAWNGLMLAAFAEAARVVGEPAKRRTYFQVAIRNADFLLNSLRADGHLRRTWRQGVLGHDVFLEDFSSLILALLELYQTDFGLRWFSAARELADEMIDRFSDPAGGFLDTPADSPALFMRPKDLQDNATPSGNALAARALLELASLTAVGQYRDLAEQALSLVGSAAVEHPTAFACWLAAADFAARGNQQLAILYVRDLPPEFLKVAREQYRPNLLVATSPYPPAAAAPPLLADRPLKDGKPTAYVCDNFVCQTPVTEANGLREQLRRHESRSADSHRLS